jgi:uncharacterized linocin/CFP29 family protein
MLKKWVVKYPAGVYTTDGNVIYCQPCKQKVKFDILPSAITRLESQGLTLEQSLNILGEVKTKIANAIGPIGKTIQNKLDNVVTKNAGLAKIVDIAKVLTGGEADLDMQPGQMASMKFAPLTSCDVERSFSVYKNILADNRMRFKPENLEKYLICNCERRE